MKFLDLGALGRFFISLDPVAADILLFSIFDVPVPSAANKLLGIHHWAL